MPYLPTKLPDVGDDPHALALAKYLEKELERVAAAQLDDIQALELRPAHVSPAKPRTGMIVYADGTDWNPGFGEGVYSRKSDGTWVKLFP